MSGIVVSTDSWTADLPSGWQAPESSRPRYVEAPDGTAGAYFSEMLIRVGDLEHGVRRVRAAELDSLPGGADRWQIVRESERFTPTGAEISTDYYQGDDCYLICSRVLGQGRRVVRMSFHDYDCENPDRSTHRPHVWLQTLAIREPGGPPPPRA